MSQQFSICGKRLSDQAHQASYMQLLGKAKEQQVKRLLDLGCGDGKFTIDFATKIGAKEIYGVDIDEFCCLKAEERGIKVVLADLNKPLPLPSNHFDLILSSEAMQHLANPDNLLEESYRLLRPNGHLYISTSNLCSLHNRVLVLFGQQPTAIGASARHILKIPILGYVGGGRNNLRGFSPNAFLQMLITYGFRIEHYFGSGFFPFQGKAASMLSSLFPTFSVFQTAIAIKSM